jgi:glycopeptide antibiotics resistance protein
MFPVHVPLASNRVRYGMVLFVAAIIIFLSVVNPAAIKGESNVGGQSYGPFGIDYGPLGWLESDTWAHGMGYALFTATLGYAFVAPVQTSRLRRLALAVCVAIVFGVCMELVQTTLPYRNADVLEATVNAISACLMAAVWWLMTQTRNVRFGSADGVT